MKKNFCIIGMAMGAIIVVLGLYYAFGYNGYTFSGSSSASYTFGADYYTEEYTATRNAANNVLGLGANYRDAMKFTFRTIGFVISALGGVIICFFGYKLEEAKKHKTGPAAMYGQPAFAAPTPGAVREMPSGRVNDELADAKMLFETGVLNREEYEVLKNKIVQRR